MFVFLAAFSNSLIKDEQRMSNNEQRMSKELPQLFYQLIENQQSKLSKPENKKTYKKMGNFITFPSRMQQKSV